MTLSRWASWHVPEPSLSSKVSDWFAGREPARNVALNLGVALLAWGLAELVVLPTAGGRAVTPVWPAAGLGVACVYLGGYRLLPGVILGSFAFNAMRSPLYWAAMIGLIQAVQPLKSAFGERLSHIRVQHSGYDRLLKIAVRIPGDFVEPEIALRSFDANWWINNCQRSSGALVFDYEIQDAV